MIVSILGCGWLGQALAKDLLSNSFEVNGSTTHEENLEILHSIGMKSYVIKLDEHDALEQNSDFWACDALIIASNVNLQGNPGYISGLEAVAKIVTLKKIRRLIVISSTSIYGEPNDYVDESTKPFAKTKSAERLLEIENLFKHIAGTQTTMMRCGGLVGPGRMPGSFLAGKQNIANGLAPVNLIHLLDCIGILKCLLRTEQTIDCINAVAPDHPSRYEFYTAAANAQTLPLPEFILEKQAWKVVSSETIKLLGYRYQIAKWLQWLNTEQ